MSDPSTCDHEWVDDGTLEVFPPIATSHCRKCGLKRHVKTGSGQTTYFPPSHASDPPGSVSSPALGGKTRAD
jgi:hypothetical protein